MDFKDHYFYQHVMEDSNLNLPAKNLVRKNTNTFNDTHELITNNVEISVLESINKKAGNARDAPPGD